MTSFAGVNNISLNEANEMHVYKSCIKNRLNWMLAGFWGLGCDEWSRTFHLSSLTVFVTLFRHEFQWGMCWSGEAHSWKDWRWVGMDWDELVHLKRNYELIHLCFGWISAGVKSIDTNVAEKKVIVDAEPTVSPEVMLEKLKKVRQDYSGKFRFYQLVGY